MNSHSATRSAPGPSAQAGAGTSTRRVGRRRVLRHRGLDAETRLAIRLTALAILVAALILVFPTVFPPIALMLPLLVGCLFLDPRTLPWFVVLVMALVTLEILVVTRGVLEGFLDYPYLIDERLIGATAVQFLMGLVVLFTSFQRSRLGVGGLRGESMLVDLRDRILTQGGIPPLPAQWRVGSAIHSAGGTPFAGDFVVATRVGDPDRLEVVVVDVSGKGTDAGTRALQLSGAIGGLLGALRPEEFLPAANEYLLRQDWEEGFATAVHLSLDLGSGRYEVRAAGHPPALHLDGTSRRWEVLASQGPVLGLIDGAEYGASHGVLAPGDAVLLYTDGMVEDPQRDIEDGIGRLRDEAGPMLVTEQEQAAQQLVTRLGSPDDDRAVVVVHRR